MEGEMLPAVRRVESRIRSIAMGIRMIIFFRSEDVEWKDFFWFETGTVRGAVHAKFDEPTDLCSYEILRGEARLEGVLHFKHFSGKKYLDTITTTYPPVTLVSDHFVEALQKNGITGWRTYPIHLEEKKKREIPGYHGLIVTGRCGNITRDGRVVVHRLNKRAKSGGHPVWIGVPFDVGQWDGTDLFIPRLYEGRLSGLVILSPRAEEVIAEENISNCRPMPLPEFETDF